MFLLMYQMENSTQKPKQTRGEISREGSKRERVCAEGRCGT